MKSFYQPAAAQAAQLAAAAAAHRRSNRRCSSPASAAPAASSMSKRSRQEQQDDTGDGDGVSILLADGGEPLTAERHLLACASCVFRGLPASPCWDLSSLRIDGQPVAREVVLDWLNAVHMQLHDEPFDKRHRLHATTVVGLANLLELADALGSPRGVLRACCAGLEQLALAVPSDSSPRHIPLDGRVSACDIVYDTGGHLALEWFGIDIHRFHDPSYYYTASLNAVTRLGPGANWADAAAKQREVEAALAAQLERLLWLALKLELVPLADKLHAFIAANSLAGTHSMFYYNANTRSDIFSERVVAAAAAASGMARPAWIDAIAGQEISFEMRGDSSGGGGDSGTLFITPEGGESLPPVDFSAVMGRDFFCWRKGETVKVQLNLFEPANANELEWENPNLLFPHVVINDKVLRLRLAVV